MAGAEPGLGETGGPKPSFPPPLHPMAQPYSHPHIHLVPDTVTQSKADITTQPHNFPTGMYATPSHIHMYAWSCALTIALLSMVSHTVTHS